MLVQEEARNRTGRPGLILHGMAPPGRILTTDNWKNKLLTGLALYVKTGRIMLDQTPTENTLDVEGLLTKLRTARCRKVGNIATTPSVI